MSVPATFGAGGAAAARDASRLAHHRSRKRVNAVALTLSIGVFLLYKGSGTFYKYGHTVWEFLFSSDWNPTDGPSQSGGAVGSAIYIWGSLITCGLALLIALIIWNTRRH